MVQEQHQAPAVPATGDAGGIPGAFCVYRAVCACTCISAGDEEQCQPVLPHAGHVMDEYPADMRMDRILPKTAGRQGEPPIPVDADMPGEHTGRGYGDPGVVHRDL